MRISDKLIFSFINLFIYIRYFRIISKFKKRVGYYPDVASPKKYHELMFWRKVFDHNPLFTVFCDKIATKEYVRTILPDALLPETLWVGEDIAHIPEELRKADAVLKGNHGSSFNHFGGIERGDCARLKAATREWLKTDYGRSKHEWGYFKARKLLFLEERLVIPEGAELIDVSIRCSNGKAILASACTGNKTDAKKFGYYDLAGKRCVSFEIKDPEDGKLPAGFSLPASFPLVVDYARRLSVGVDYARFDFLCVGDRVYPGEITVYPGGGLTSCDDAGIDAVIVNGWDITSSWFLQTPQTGWRKYYARAVRRHFECTKQARGTYPGLGAWGASSEA
jgi:hypothetical protein